MHGLKEKAAALPGLTMPTVPAQLKLNVSYRINKSSISLKKTIQKYHVLYMDGST